MIIQKEKCDQCGLEVDDYYIHLGWIKFKIDYISMSGGRDKKGVAITDFISNKVLDFCSNECFNSYFTKVFKVKEKKYASQTNSRSKNKKVASRNKAS